MFMRNCWYVAAWSSEIVAGKLVPRTLLNEKVLLYRDSTGQIVAIEDRCCHRGAPLALGRLEGDCVRCMYHGLLFDPSGKCVDVPTQVTIPPSLKIKSYAVAEADSLIWIWMGNQENADPAAIPGFEYLSKPEWHGIPGYLHYNANYLLITDNLADLVHIAYVHTNTLGGSEEYAREHVQSPLQKSADGFSLTKWHHNSDLPPFAAKVNSTLKKVDRWNSVHLKAPAFFYLESGFGPVGQDLKKDRTGVLEFRNFQAMTPETDKTTHFFWVYMHQETDNVDAISASLHDSILEAFHEDMIFIEQQQRVLDDDPDFQLKAIAADAPLLHLRWLIEKNIKAETAPRAALVSA